MSDKRGPAAEEQVTLPSPPDATAVNEAWPAEVATGARGLLGRLIDRLLSPRLAPQREFNARQVRLDNDLLVYLQSRFAATHENYDRTLALVGRRLDEVDARHRRLEAELQAHVRDIVERVDVVLEEATRGGLARDYAIEDVRARLVRIEEALRRRGE